RADEDLHRSALQRRQPPAANHFGFSDYPPEDYYERAAHVSSFGLMAAFGCRSVVSWRIAAVTLVLSVSIVMVAMWIARVVVAIKTRITRAVVSTIIGVIAAA
uniref:Uncharacterized protein n=1 Tax=Romanomermis culicivorax TaxID=13658 RepID=A0A915JAC6_ROMCU